MKKRVICHILYMAENSAVLEHHVRDLEEGLKDLDFTVGTVSKNSDFRTALETINQNIFPHSALVVKKHFFY
jgi:hypothetical protein